MDTKETRFETRNVITYEVFSNINAERKFLYATDSLEDLKEHMEKLNEKFNRENYGIGEE